MICWEALAQLRVPIEEGLGRRCGLLATIRVLDVVCLKCSHRPVLFVLSFGMMWRSEDGERECREEGYGGSLHADVRIGVDL